MPSDAIDWKKIKALRSSFLHAQGDLADYWKDEALLTAYDQTLAQRIGWKWRAVLDVMVERIPEALRSMPLWVDWGCGTGIASRTLLAHGGLRCDELLTYDRSARAQRFAQARLRAEFPKQKLAEPQHVSQIDRPFVLLISHVLSEMPPAARAELVQLCNRASLIVWVEAGRTLESRGLSEIREQLRARKTILGPCLHQEPCGILAQDQNENWCHFQAPIPQEVFRSAFWKTCSQELGFDLRRLPVSYLVAAQAELAPQASDQEVPWRILGGSRAYKAFCRWTACTPQGILEGEFLKRRSRAVFQGLIDSDLATQYTREELEGSSSTPQD